MTGVSFVVTVYNKARFLPAVLSAIFAQEGDFEREYIFIDDGSHDDSVAVMEQLCTGRCNVQIIRQANTGPAKATNAAVNAAHQPWLKIVDGDDVLAPWCTSSLLDAASTSGTRFALGRDVAYLPGADINFAPDAAYAVYRRDLFSECLRNVPCNLTPTLIHRDFYWEVGGCDERIFVQDYSLLLRLAWREAPAMLERPVCAIAEEADDRLSDDQRLMLKDVNQAVRYFLAETPKLPFRIRYKAIERAFGRAWKWQHRKLGASVVSRWFWLYALAKSGLPALLMSHLAESVNAFAAPLGEDNADDKKYE